MCLCLFLCHSMCDVSVFIFSKQRLHGAELSQSNLWVTGSWTPGKLQAAASQQERPSQSVQQISCRSTIMLHWTSLDSNCERKLWGKTSYNIGKILFCGSVYQEVHFVKILLFFSEWWWGFCIISLISAQEKNHAFLFLGCQLLRYHLKQKLQKTLMSVWNLYCCYSFIPVEPLSKALYQVFDSVLCLVFLQIHCFLCSHSGLSDF